jgi:hypothetical protein
VWAIFLAATVVGGLVALAAIVPERREELRAARLAGLLELLREGRITRAQAEDGAVLARGLGKTDEEKIFKMAARLRRKKR